MAKTGRPLTVLTDEQLAQVEALASVMSADLIADYLGMGRSTFYEVMKRQEGVSGRYKRGKAKAVGNVAQGLLKQAMDGNTTAAIFYLKTQAGWAETQKIDQTNDSKIEHSLSKKSMRALLDEIQDEL